MDRLKRIFERELDPKLGGKLLVFLETKRMCDEVCRRLRMDGWPALSIHGDKSQLERDWVLQVRKEHDQQYIINLSTCEEV